MSPGERKWRRMSFCFTAILRRGGFPLDESDRGDFRMTRTAPRGVLGSGFVRIGYRKGAASRLQKRAAAGVSPECIARRTVDEHSCSGPSRTVLAGRRADRAVGILGRADGVREIGPQRGQHFQRRARYHARAVGGDNCDHLPGLQDNRHRLGYRCGLSFSSCSLFHSAPSRLVRFLKP